MSIEKAERCRKGKELNTRPKKGEICVFSWGTMLKAVC